MYENLVERLNKYSAEHEHHGGITAEAADAIEELQHSVDILGDANAKLREKAPEWIPVAERLPERRKWVLCRCEANITEVLRYENNEWYHDPRHVYYFNFVTHWMPIPTPPKEKT